MKNRLSRTLAALFALLALAAAARADQQTFSSNIDENTYILSAGDLITINIWGDDEETLQLTVNPEGFLFIPRLGPIDTSGRTLKDVRAEIMEKFAASRHDIEVFVELTRPKTIKIKVLGFVQTPGVYSLQAPKTLLEILSTSGANITPLGSRKNVEIRRAGKTVLTVNTQDALMGKEGAEDPQISDGDEIYVPANAARIEVEGEFARPGTYELGPADTLLSIIHEAGGPTIRAEASRVVVARKDVDVTIKEIPVDIAALFFRNDASADMPLQPGDRIIAPRSDFVFVIGAVGSPRKMSYDGGMDILDYIVESGGPTQEAALKAATILRGPLDNVEHIPVDLNAVFRGDSVAAPPRILPGDVIVIPGRSKTKLSDYMSYIFNIYSYVKFFENVIED